MNIAERMATLREEAPACRLVAFGDAETRLILRTDSDATHPQEYLDRIAQDAAQAFTFFDAATVDGGGDEAAKSIVMMTPDHTRLLVRSGRNKADFLCCEMPLKSGIEGAEQAAARFLDDVAGE